MEVGTCRRTGAVIVASGNMVNEFTSLPRQFFHPEQHAEPLYFVISVLRRDCKVVKIPKNSKPGSQKSTGYFSLVKSWIYYTDLVKQSITIRLRKCPLHAMPPKSKICDILSIITLRHPHPPPIMPTSTPNSWWYE